MAPRTPDEAAAPEGDSPPEPEAAAPEGDSPPVHIAADGSAWLSSEATLREQPPVD